MRYTYNLQIYGKEIPVIAASGQVMSGNMFATTRVFGNQGHVSSNTFLSNELWLKMNDDTELRLVVDANRIQVREGQNVTLLGNQAGRIIAVLNKNSKTYTYWTDDAIYDIESKKYGCLVYTVAGILILLFLGLKEAPSIPFIIISVLLVGYSWWKYDNDASFIYNTLDPQIKKIFDAELNRN